jgi:pyruvate/2-oxoglutarate dehydrogenase complex dihydrolipoamide acyltransferase (E2) component
LSEAKDLSSGQNLLVGPLLRLGITAQKLFNNSMPQVPILMPQLGESIAEATIVTIKVQPGEKVAADQEIMEVETNKAVMGVTTPCAGEVGKIDAQVKETYPIGAVLGYIEASEKDAARFTQQAATEIRREVPQEIPGRAGEEKVAAKKTATNGAETKISRDGLPVPAAAKGAGFLSPRLRARMIELQLTASDLAGIAGTGTGNRVTIKDLESYLKKMESQTTSDASAIRVGVAEAMRRSWSRPLATVGSSVDLDPVLNDRKKRDPKPGPALYALRALAMALAENPTAAAKLIGSRVLQSSGIDVGLAIEAQDGIIVPIIRNADKTSLADLTKRYEELVALGRQRRISPEMQSGGIAAVSNFGTFGVEWGTPIPLPDQTMILGLGVGKKTPRWDESRSEFVPATEAQITLSFDHRSLDGGGAGRLLKRVIELLERPETL